VVLAVALTAIVSAQLPSSGVIRMEWQALLNRANTWTGLQTFTGGCAGCGASPAGAGTELQYRLNGTTFGAVAGSAWDGSVLTLPNSAGSITIGNEEVVPSTIFYLGTAENPWGRVYSQRFVAGFPDVETSLDILGAVSSDPASISVSHDGVAVDVGLDLRTFGNGGVRIRNREDTEDRNLGAATVTSSAFIAKTTTPIVGNIGANSCGTTAATITGRDNAFAITVGATAGTDCRVTFDTTAPNTWACAFSNQTTGNLARQTAATTTTSDVSGTFVAGDVLIGVCFAR
jgi:hypothetical protein